MTRFTKLRAHLVHAFFSTLLLASIDLHANEDSLGKTKETSTLYVFRPHHSPPFVYKPMISINGKDAFYLPRGHYAEIELEAGEYLIKADWTSGSLVPDKSFTVSLEPNTSIYVNAGTKMSFVYFGGVVVVGSTQNKLDEDGGNQAPDLSKLSRIYQWQPGWPKYQDPKNSGLEEKYQLTFDEKRFLQDYASASLLEKRGLLTFILHHKLVSDDFVTLSRELVLNHLDQQNFNKYELYTLRVSLKLLATHKSELNKEALRTVFNQATNKTLSKSARKLGNRFYDLKLKK